MADNRPQFKLGKHVGLPQINAMRPPFKITRPTPRAAQAKIVAGFVKMPEDPAAPPGVIPARGMLTYMYTVPILVTVTGVDQWALPDRLPPRRIF